MPLYFLHLRDGVDELLDPDGSDMPLEVVKAAALANARDCMAGDIRNGRLNLAHRIDVEDEQGNVVHTVKFIDAVEIASA